MSVRRESNAFPPDREMDAILASLADGFLAVDESWRCTHANRASERILRRGRGTLVGAEVFDALAPAADDPLRAATLASKESNTSVALSAPAPHLGAWIEVRGFPHTGGYAMLLRDVSDERRAHRGWLQAEGERRAQRQTDRNIFETTLDLVLVVDRRGQFIQVSPSSEAILGYRPEELTGRNAAEFLHTADLEQARAEMRQARRARLMRNFEARYVHKSGRLVTLAFTGIWSELEQQHFFIGRDMSERMAAEERLRRAQRLEAVGQLTGGLAHDFNNLLTVVIGSLDMLQERIGADSMAGGLAETALKASLRGAALTRQLLAFAQRQSLDAKVIDVNERVSAIIDLLQRTLGEQIEIETLLQPDLWPALVDPTQLESAVVNLAINARDAMTGGGRLMIETANKLIDAHYVGTNFEATPGDYVMLAVSDTGTGMPPETVARAFEPFFTTKPTGKGSGLGLSMVYGFVQQSRGHVQIYSEVGQGTSVRLYLPRAITGAVTALEAKPETLARAKPGERILAVEDNAEVRKVVVAQLHELGYELIGVGNGEAALAVLAHAGPVDLLFTDIVMPGGMTGYDLARAARSMRPALKVLLTSGFPKMALSDEEAGRDFANLLIKPYRKAELAAKVRAVLDG